MWILIVIFHVNSGSSGMHIEFETNATCEAARTMLYAERARVRTGLETAFCVKR